MSDWNTTEGWSSGFSGAASGAEAGMSIGGPIGAVVGGLGGFVGGLFGHKKKTDWNKKYFNESVRQFNVQDEYNKNQMQYRVKDAIKAGVNPVAALSGSGGHYSPTISAGGAGGDTGQQSSNFVDSAGRIAGLFSKEQRQNRAIELESANLDLESKRLQNQILKQQLLSERQPGIVSKGSTPSIGDLYLPWKDRRGNIVYLLNPDAIADADWSNLEALKAYASNPGDALSPGGTNWFRRFWYNIASRSNPLAEIYPNKRWR